MKVLIGVDGSSESERAVELVGRLLSTETVDVTLFYAPPFGNLRDVAASKHAELRAARESMAETIFARAMIHLPIALRSRVQTIVGTRKPRKGILLAAARSGSDMIAVGATGASNISKMLLGSVSRAVVYGATVPVLIARGFRPMAEPMRILLTYDREGTMSEAVRFAERLTWPADALAYAVHVKESIFHGPMPSWLAEEIPPIYSDKIFKAWIEEQEQEAVNAKLDLEALCQRMPRPFCDAKPAFVEGHCGEEIVTYIDDNKIDLVILGARVQSTLDRILGGSTSGYVLAHASCSALIVPHYDTP
jgi:nucleotide-binding universal stress UspA family protein